MEGDKEYYMSKGMDEYMAKPVGVDDLRRTLTLVKEKQIVSNALTGA